MMPGKRRLKRKLIKNFNDIARKCIWMLKKRRRSKKEEWSISRGQETSTSRRTVEGLKSQLSWSNRHERKCRKTRSTDQRMLYYAR